MIGEQHNLFAKHPKTIFIAAHMGWMAHDLQALGCDARSYAESQR